MGWLCANPTFKIHTVSVRVEKNQPVGLENHQPNLQNTIFGLTG
jgi:hypothetical protein